MFYDRKYYELLWNGTPTEVLEPLEWDEDEKSFERNLTYHGIATMLATSLTFVKGAKGLLEVVLADEGINADVRLRKLVRNPQTDIWEIDYEGWVDFSTYKITEEGFNVSMTADPLTTLFKSKNSSKVELERTTSLTGKILNPLPLRDLYIEGRDILVTDKLVQADEARLSIFGSGGSTTIQACRIDEQGDVNTGIIDVKSQTLADSRTFGQVGRVDENFLGWNDFQQTMNYRVNITFKSSMFAYYDDFVTFRVMLNVFQQSEAQVHVPSKSITLWSYTGPIWEMPRVIDLDDSRYSQYTGEIQLEMAPGQGAGLHVMVDWGNDGGQIYDSYPLSCGGIGIGSPPYDRSNCRYLDENGNWAPSIYECSVTVNEDSTRVGSTAKCIEINEYAKRLTDIVLECDYESTLLSESNVGDIVLTHGMWLRGMKAGANNFKPLSTSLKDFIAALQTVLPIGIDLTGNKMVLEKMEHFYQPYVGIDLGEVSELVISPAIKDCYSTISLGYKNQIGYDEDSGLDEYNRSTHYNTILNKIDSTLSLEGKYRSDPYGLESVRRENPLVGLGTKSDDDDTKFDDDIWFVDANEIPNAANLEVSSWQKRFAKPPANVYSPETAFNLYFTPINTLIRYGSWIKSSLLKYLDSKIAFNSSEGNSAIVTELIGGKPYSQRDGIPVGDFERSIHQAKEATFKANITWVQLNGTSYGKPNRYAQVAFTRFGTKYRGYIMKVTTQDGIGEFTVKLATTGTAGSSYQELKL